MTIIKKKFSQTDINIIQSYKSQIDTKQLTKTRLLHKLKENHSLKISPATLTKILLDNY